MCTYNTRKYLSLEKSMGQRAAFRMYHEIGETPVPYSSAGSAKTNAQVATDEGETCIYFAGQPIYWWIT